MLRDVPSSITVLHAVRSMCEVALHVTDVIMLHSVTYSMDGVPMFAALLKPWSPGDCPRFK